ncbi:MAG TPA: ABC transporter ATP-binding protein [Methylomirabilota bacterium]|nr:ABC transporter ATP-binding protein [Methylomirabilota bacterium]
MSGAATGPPANSGGLRLERLTKRFGALTAVRELSITVEPGAIYGLIGPNGSGKTTTVKMLAGLYRPTGGRIEVAGVDLRAEPERAKRAMGYLPDEPFVYEKLSGREFLHLMGELYGVPRPERAARIERLLRLFPLSAVIDTYIENYSRGNKQKLTILAALLHEPRVLVADEPIVGLDPESTLTARQIFTSFARDGGAVLVCTHTLGFAEAICHRVGLLSEGVLIQEGDLASLRETAGLPEASLEALYLHFTRARSGGAT